MFYPRVENSKCLRTIKLSSNKTYNGKKLKPIVFGLSPLIHDSQKINLGILMIFLK